MAPAASHSALLSWALLLFVFAHVSCKSKLHMKSACSIELVESVDEVILLSSTRMLAVEFRHHLFVALAVL